MTDPVLLPFDTRAAFQQHLGAVLARAQATLVMFDPDFALFRLGAPDVDATLRRFLHGGGQLRLALHDPAYLEREAPRFIRLLQDYAHGIECRRTPRGLRSLTDSFCIADDQHIVRRFHSDHLRGEAAFDAPQQTELSRQRFDAIWAESQPGLQTSVTGL
ncbi:hypothetical protein NX784_07975 [Massilia pinisoli]|uniref:DUF7931 domain-containing protein n=1 Tax=Massilia pinisoli TaxID=1772194 RepID=A0ABT1ZNM6_9BURK|nr:hypothetical protein [Massilia pinisoli]MCS0581526.1 hypothetical protein [Massilia pinisoli]